MEFYDVVNKRRTIRYFENKAIPQEVLERILNAGLMAPSSDHLREWAPVVLTNKTAIKSVTGIVKPYPCNITTPQSPQQEMFKIAFPRQKSMLEDAGCLVLPYFLQKASMYKPGNVFALINYGATWALIENMLLAATNEGLGCAIHVPVGKEDAFFRSVVGVPEEYTLPCVIAIGYPSENAQTPSQVEATIANRVHWNKW